METPYSPLLAFDQAHSDPLIGVDEAGRGALSGAVYVAAFHCPDPEESLKRYPELATVNDSKKLSPAKRTELRACLEQVGAYCVKSASCAEIEREGILGCVDRLMRETSQELAQQIIAEKSPLVLVDGHRRIPRLTLPQQELKKGDSLSWHIAAASILAKTARDRYMEGLATHFPHYGWAQNKGYGTAAHRAAIVKYGLTPEHRALFVRKILCEPQNCARCGRTDRHRQISLGS